jgi:hypothetical protein
MALARARWFGLPGLAAVAVSVGLAIVACGTGFEPESLVDTVRILASQADHPFAQPGQTVNLKVLAYDARPIKAAPMQVWWLPVVCINPTDDAYYECFEGLGGAGDAGVGDAGAGSLASPDGGTVALPMLRSGIDLTPYLVAGTDFSLTLPSNIITSHPTPPSGTEPYGLVIAFNIACAGHVELLPFDVTSANPVQVPIGCFDENENPLGPDDYVIGFTRVYAYTTWTNTNPVISQVTFNGNAVTDAGIVVPHCTSRKQADCTSYSLDTVVPPSSDLPNPAVLGSNGQPVNEEIWVDYFTTQGSLDDDARLLYDPVQGQISNTATNFRPPKTAGSAVLWSVVHDNRGGASWQQMAVQVQ